MSPRKPLRSYGMFLTAVGDRFEMQVANVGRETLQKLMAVDAIGEAEIWDLVKRHKIHVNSADVHALTWAVNAMRVTEPSDVVIEDVAAATRLKECRAVASRGAKKIAALLSHLDKLDPAGEGFIRFRGDRGPGVIQIDTAVLARFHSEADRAMQYLRDWSARPQDFREITLHGDIMHVAQIVERTARRAGTKPGFANATGRGVKFIEAILIRAGVIRRSKKASNDGMICQTIKRRRRKLKELKSNQSN